MTITVYGTPAPQGSKAFKGFTKSGRAIMIESSKKVKPWREAVVWAVRDVWGGKPPITRAVRVYMGFMLARPKSLPKRVTFHTKRPDLDKLVRATFDGIVQAGWIKDDSQIHSLCAEKFYTIGAPLAQITVTETEG